MHYTFIIVNYMRPYIKINKPLVDYTRLHSAVGNVSGYRCESDCKYRVASLIPTRSHTFVEIDHKTISTDILLPSAESFKRGCCQLQAKVCAQSTG